MYVDRWGWLEGLEILGRTEETKKTAGKIVQAIKDRMNGRKETQRINSEKIAEAAGVSVRLLSNVIESGFIDNRLGRYGIESAKPHATGRLSYRLTIPVHFGQEFL